MFNHVKTAAAHTPYCVAFSALDTHTHTDTHTLRYNMQNG